MVFRSEKIQFIKTKINSLCTPFGFQRFASFVRLPLNLAQVQGLPIVGILIVAAILRLNHINQPFTDAFNWRQASTAMMAENYFRTNWNIFYPEVNWGGAGPNYQGREFQTMSYIAALLYVILGQHDWVGRGVAVVFGVWGIFALYQLVCRVWDKERALVSAAVMAILPGSIFIERSFLPDPAMVALVTTSVWLLVAYLQTERRRYLILATIIAIWALVTKIPGLIVGLPVVYATLTILKAQRKVNATKLITLSIVGSIVLIPVIAYYLWARHLSLTYPPYHFAGADNWLWKRGLQAWLAQSYFLPKLQWIAVHRLGTVPAIFLAVLGLLFPLLRGGIGRELPKDERSSIPSLLSNKAPWLFHWWFLAGMVYYFIGAEELIKNPWNFHIVTPAIAALIGQAIILIAKFISWLIQRSALAQISRLKRPNWPLATAIVCLLLIGVSGRLNLQPLYRPYAHENYVMGLALRQVSQPDDLVVTIASQIGNPGAIYYSQRRGWLFPHADSGINWVQLPRDDSEAIRILEELRARGADWLAIADKHTKVLWTTYPTFIEHLRHVGEFHSRTPEYVIYRLRSPEEVASPLISQTFYDDMPVATREIRYHMPETGEVFLVWGIDGWQMVSEELRPAGTTVTENGVMKTPMNDKGDIFVSKIQTPINATINYGFLVATQDNGAASETIWYGPKDYQVISVEDGVIEVKVKTALVRTTEK